MALRSVTTAPEFVRDKPPLDAATICEPPKTLSILPRKVELVSGEMLPKMTRAVPAGRMAPGEKRWRSVSVVLVKVRVRSS